MTDAADINLGAVRSDHASVFADPHKRQITRRGHGPHPKPNTIPIPKRLRHLPVDRFGYPIPWVSDWTGTKADGGLIFSEVPGHPEWGHYLDDEPGIGIGHPLPGNLSSARQVRAMLGRLCGVCGRGITGKAILMGAATLIDEGFREPPVHRECARYSLQACPGINRGRVVVVEAVTYGVAPLFADQDGNTYSQRGLVTPLPVAYILGLPRTDSRNTVWTVDAWARRNKVCPHPMLDGGFPTYNIGDQATYPDVVDPLDDWRTPTGKKPDDPRAGCPVDHAVAVDAPDEDES